MPDGPTFSLAPALRAATVYPFQRLTDAKARVAPVLAARGVELVDLGAGEPREPVPAFVREALAGAVLEEEISPYPLAAGLPELREAIAAWAGRRYGTRLDPTTEVIPTLGSKEVCYLLAQALCDLPGGRDRVGVPVPAYPVYARGAEMAGAEVLGVPAGAGWLPDLDAIAEADWRRMALLWVTSPGNPTGAVAPLDWLRDAAERCRRRGVVLACDEAYSELWFAGEAPPSALQLDDRRNVLVINTLSKRSSIPGYRSGFVAGDARIVAALRRLRPSVGVAPQRAVQRAAIAAWSDEEHVVATRERFRRKLAALQPGLDALGLRSVGGEGSFFRWLAVPEGWARAPWARRALAAPSAGGASAPELADVLADRRPGARPARAPGDVELVAALLVHGIAATPGSLFLGDAAPAGPAHLRVALVPTVEACAEAARRLVALAGSGAHG